MTPHDTPDAVEAMAGSIAARIDEVYAGHGNVVEIPDAELTEAAAMLCRLHQRAVDAEREREALQAATAQHHLELAAMVQAQVATARADALREAAGVAGGFDTLRHIEYDMRTGIFPKMSEKHLAIKDNILALVQLTTGET